MCRRKLFARGKTFVNQHFATNGHASTSIGFEFVRIHNTVSSVEIPRAYRYLLVLPQLSTRRHKRFAVPDIKRIILLFCPLSPYSRRYGLPTVSTVDDYVSCTPTSIVFGMTISRIKWIHHKIGLIVQEQDHSEVNTASSSCCRLFNFRCCFQVFTSKYFCQFYCG